MVSIWQIIALPIVEAIAVGALCGFVGSLALLNQRIFFTESITHAAFPGAVIGVVVTSVYTIDQNVLSIGLFIGAALACIVLSFMMHVLSKLKGISSQASAGITLTVGFASGYFLNKWFAPLPLRIEGFLTGSLLNCTPADVIFAIIAFALALGLWSFNSANLIHCSFDSTNYKALGGRSGLMQGIVLALIIITVSVIIPAVGTVVSVSLIAAPAAALKSRMRSINKFVFACVLSSIFIALLGLALAVILRLSAGGTISICAGCFFLVVKLSESIFLKIHEIYSGFCKKSYLKSRSVVLE
ncbi:metal ABC transporter permease [Gardnerella sp. DNF00257]|uniref:metal ABC transporter permease n=1 Tax=Gardnerella sp. DNF00257 TaxID=2749045 RepID=UPI003BB12E42